MPQWFKIFKFLSNSLGPILMTICQLIIVSLGLKSHLEKSTKKYSLSLHAT